MSTQHARFQARLEGSRPAVEAVAAWLRAKGYELTVPETIIAPSAEVACFYVDDGDIILADGRVIEVKGVHKDFQGRGSWPFGEMFLGPPSQHERFPDAIYISISRDLRYAGVVLPATKARWYRTTMRNSNTGNIEERYACPLDCVIWKRVRP